MNIWNTMNLKNSMHITFYDLLIFIFILFLLIICFDILIPVKYHLGSASVRSSLSTHDTPSFLSLIVPFSVIFISIEEIRLLPLTTIISTDFCASFSWDETTSFILFFISLCFPHNTAYRPHTINIAPGTQKFWEKC